MPSPQRCVGEPVAGLLPVRPAGHSVEDLEDLVVGRGRALRSRALMLRKGGEPLLERSPGWSAQARVRVAQLPERRAGEQSRQAAGQTRVVADPETGHRSKVAHARGQAARKAVVGEIQGHNPADGISLDPVPVAQRVVAEPALGVRPATAACRLVQRPEDLRVQVGAGGTASILDAREPTDQAGRKAQTRVFLERKTVQGQAREAQR